MKKFKLLFVLVAILGLVGLASCTNLSNLTFGSDNDLLAFYSLTSANILNDNVNAEQRARLKKDATTEVGNQENINMEKVNEYLQMMENMFSNESPIIMEEETSDKPQYEKKVEFLVTDLTGTKATYVIYYNQFEKIEEDDDENEREYRLEGIAIIDEIEYQIKGEREQEDNESSLDIIIKLDDQNYVAIEQETEKAEQEYEYEVFKNGKKYTSISFEVERSQKFEAEFITSEKGYQERYRFYKKNEKVWIKYQSKEKVFTIRAAAKINPETNEVVYEYKVTETNQEYYFKK